MPYVTSIERVARREALRKGIAACLKIRFGPEGLNLMPEIEEIHDGDLLEAILQAIENANSPEEIRSLWSPPTP